jgi:hypothetical protein
MQSETRFQKRVLKLKMLSIMYPIAKKKENYINVSEEAKMPNKTE